MGRGRWGVSALPVALVGLGHVHAAAYAALLADGERARLCAFVEADDALAAAFGREFGVARAADAAEARRRGARALIVAGDNAESTPALWQAVNAGLPCLAEKPLGIRPRATAAAVAAFEGAGLPLGTAFPMRFSPAVTALVEIVREGRLGTLVAIVGENVGRYPGLWFGDPARSGGGAFTDHVSHLADIYALVTDTEPLRATALPGRALDTGAERTAGLLLDYPGERYASVDASWARPAAYPAWGGLSLEVVGEAGTAVARPFAPRVDAWTEPATWLRYADDLDRAMLDDFAQAVEAGRTPRASGRDGLRALAIVSAALASHRDGRAAPVPSLEELLP